MLKKIINEIVSDIIKTSSKISEDEIKQLSNTYGIAYKELRKYQKNIENSISKIQDPKKEFNIKSLVTKFRTLIDELDDLTIELEQILKKV